MNTDPADIDLIERFLSGQLTHTEAVDFETRLGEDHEFARKLRLRKNFPSLFKAEGKDEIVMTVEDTPEVRVKREKPRTVKTRHIFWTAIILLSAGILGYFMFIRTSPPGQKTGDQKTVSRALVNAKVPVKTTVKYAEQPQANLKAAELMQTRVKSEEQPQTNVKVAERSEANVKAAELIQTAVKPEEPSQVPYKEAEAKPAPVKAEPTAPKNESTEKAAPRESMIKLNKSIELGSPADNLVVNRNEEILFTWKQATDSFTNFYIISEANNKLAWWRGIRPGIRELRVSATNFKPGRFYWYVGTKDNKRTLIVNP